jgi:LacI family transcriptional regulator
MVWLDASEPVPGYSSLVSDGRQGATTGVRHLVEVHGHASVGLLIGNEGSTDPREHGWRDTLHDADLPDGPVVRVPWSRQGGYEGGLRLLGRRGRPTAVFASSDRQAVGLLRAAREAGLRVPDDLAVVSFDGTEESAFSGPPLTVIQQDIEAMAEQAVALVLDREQDPTHHTYPTSLIVRQSCGCDEPARSTPPDPSS